MKLKIYYQWGHPILVSSSALKEYFNQEDLASRQNSGKPLKDCFHINWIHDGQFLLPSFRIRNGETYIGNGRHRLTLLSKHMKFIPIDFDRFEDTSEESKSLYKSILVRELSEGEVIEFPDFPIKNLGEDINGEPTWKESASRAGNL